MKKKIYIAGKVTGEPIAQCTMKFGEAQKVLERAGYEVVNPLALVSSFKTPWQTAMRKCIAAMMEVDAVLMLSDWTKSKGATIEYEVAGNVGIPIFEDIQALVRTPLKTKD